MNSFRGLLLEISNDLTTIEIQDLKFACSDFIPAGRAEHIKRAHELFSELERMNLLGENNKDFLASVFVRINRPDLRNKLLGIKETPNLDVPQLAESVNQAEMSLNTMVISDSIINDIAEDVSVSWRMLGRKLGVKETFIDNIDDENKKVADKAVKVLYKWKRINGDRATVQALMTGLKKAGRTDLAEDVRDKVYAEGASSRPADENQDNPTPGVAFSQPFPKMADLDPTHHVGVQELQGHLLPRGVTVPSGHAVGGSYEHHDAPLSNNQPAVVDKDEEAIREETAAVANEQPVPDSTDTSRMPVQSQETEKQQKLDKTNTSQMPVQAQETEKQQNLDKTDTSRMPVQAQEITEKPNISSSDTSRIPVQVEDMKSPPVTFGNFLNPAKYEVAKCIGHGGFSKVYLCYNKETGAECAAKLVDLRQNDSNIRQQVEALEKEIKILKNLSNPYIVRYCYTEEEQNTLVLFMEYMKGGSIRNRLSKGPMPQSLVRKFTWQILQGLKYLHGERITHRDIKGANVLIDGDNNVKLADFGISKEMQRFSTGTTMMTDKAVTASTYWTSPELLLGKEFHRNTDCWSVGCTVIEMLTGKPPYAHLDLGPAVAQIITNGVPLPESCTPLASGFLKKCLTVDPRERPSSTELLDDPFPTLNPDE